MDNLSNEDKLKLSKQAVDSFVGKFEEGEGSKKFVIAFLTLLLGRAPSTEEVKQ